MDERLMSAGSSEDGLGPGPAVRTSPSRQRIAVLLEDWDGLRPLRAMLEPDAFDLEALGRGDDIADTVRKDPPQLVLLDADTQGLDVLGMCARLRRDAVTARIPIVVVSSRARDEDRIAALEMGADDFLAKPYSPRELALRVRAVLRRGRGRAEQTGSERVIQAGPLKLFVEEHRLVFGAEEVFLTPTECRLMFLLALRAGRILHRDSLLNEIWGKQTGRTTRTLDVHVHRLRRKLGVEGERLETVVGIGYRLRVS